MHETVAMPNLRARAPVPLPKNGLALSAEVGFKDDRAAAKIAKKSKLAASGLGGSAVTIVDDGPLLNIASTVDLEVARRAARRAGILTATGKLSSKYH